MYSAINIIYSLLYVSLNRNFLLLHGKNYWNKMKIHLIEIIEQSMNWTFPNNLKTLTKRPFDDRVELLWIRNILCVLDWSLVGQVAFLFGSYRPTNHYGHILKHFLFDFFWMTIWCLCPHCLLELHYVAVPVVNMVIVIEYLRLNRCAGEEFEGAATAAAD